MTLNKLKIAHFYPKIIYYDGKNKYESKKMVEKLFGSWVKASAPNISYTTPKNVQYTQINFVDMPNAVQSEISLVNSVNLKLSVNKNVDSFQVFINDDFYGTSVTEIQINTGDELRLVVTKDDNTKESDIIFNQELI